MNRCPHCGQAIPYKHFARWMALGTWRKQEMSRKSGYILWHGKYHKIISVAPHPKDGWKWPTVTTADFDLVIGPTTWVYEKLDAPGLDKPAKI